MRVLAIGGGGFLMEDDSQIDRQLLALTTADHPRVCFIGTAGGDLPVHIERFHRAFPPSLCAASHLAYFRRPEGGGAVPLSHAREHLMAQHAIYVGGGNTQAMLAVWRATGLADVLREAGTRGVLLAGMSAGALCWFRRGFSDLGWEGRYAAIDGLALIDADAAAHCNAGSEQRRQLHSAIGAGALSDVLALPDRTAVLFERGAVAAAWRWGDAGDPLWLRALQGTVAETGVPAARLSA